MRQYFKHNSVVLFQGDSVTDCGRTDSGGMGWGYPKKIADIHKTLFPDSGIQFINRAVSGNRVRDLLARYDADFKDVAPDFLSILIGVNDTWRRFDGNDPCSVTRFKKEYDELLTRIRRDMPTTEIMLITPFLLNTDPKKIPFHEDLDEKIDIVKSMAEKHGCLLFDYDRILKGIVSRNEYSEKALSADGVHPTDLGQSLLAIEFMKKLKVFD